MAVPEIQHGEIQNGEITDERAGWDGIQRGYAPTFSAINEANKQIEKEQEDSNLLKLAVNDQWLIAGGKRMYERRNQFTYDPNFSIDDARFNELRRAYGFRNADNLRNTVHSEDELKARESFIQEDLDRQQKIASYGFEGTAAQIGAALFDPVGWGLAVVSDGAGAALKLEGVARIASNMAISGLSNAAMEGVMYAGDTQRQADSLFYAAGMGAVMGGFIPRRAAANPRKAAVVEAADEFDSAVSRDVDEAVSMDVHKAAHEVSEEDAMVSRHMQDLHRKAEAAPRGNKKARIRKQYSQVSKRLEELKQAKISDRAARVAKIGAPRNKEEADALAEIKRSVDESYDDDIAELVAEQSRLKEANDLAENSSSNISAKLAFEQMSRQEKLDHIRSLREEGGSLEEAQKAVEPEVSRDAEKEAYVNEPDRKPQTDASTEAETASTESAEATEPTEPPEAFDLTGRKAEVVKELADEGAAAPKVIASRNPTIRKFQSAYSSLATSKNKAVRGLANRLLENPQGNAFADKTASILSYYFGNVMRSAGRNRYNDGFSSYMRANRISWVKAIVDKNVTRDFNRKVYTAIVDGEDNFEDGIITAANGVRDQMEAALKLRKQAGEAGFENVDPSPDYLPTIFDSTKMTKAVASHGREAVERLLAKGYMEGRYPLSERVAEKLAKMQYARTMDSTLTGRGVFESVVSDGERKMFLDQLKEAGIDDDVIKDFVEAKELRRMVDSQSNRSKFSLGINKSAEINGISVKDVLNTDVPELVENYIKEAAAGAAMARKGFLTKNQVLDAIDGAERYGRNQGQTAAEASDDADMLRQSVDLIYGHSLDANPSEGKVLAARRLRDFTSNVRLGNLGFAQIPEAGRLLSNLGVGTTLESIPSISWLRRRGAREGSSAGGVLREPELREIEELLGYVGEDNWLHGWSVRNEEFGENPSIIDSIGGIYDRAMAAGARANSIMSGFQATQGGLEKLAHRGLAKRIKQHLEGTHLLSKNQLDEAGFSDEFMNELKKFYEANQRTEDFNGRQVRVLNVEKMTPEMRETLGTGIARMAGRMIQRNFVGETSTWMNTWLGKFITQFKTFSLVSAEKQLIHDIRGDKIKGAQTLLFSSAIGTASYLAQSHLQALGRRDSDEYLERKLQPKAIGFGVWGKLPQTASLSIAGDFLASMGAMPDDYIGHYGTGGFNASESLGDFIPALGVLEDGGKLTKDTVSYLKGSDDVGTRQTLDKARRLIPLGNTIGIGQLTKAATDSLSD